MYGFTYSAAAPHLRELFRQPYARATRPKPGVISLGSGSTPTLLGDHLVVITDNAAGRSIVVQNWYGAPDSILSDDHRGLVPGLIRIDVREDESGCDVVWYTRELATPATVKLSTASGLIYGVMLDRDITDANVYYAHAIDFRTGRTVYRVKLGGGRRRTSSSRLPTSAPTARFTSPFAPGSSSSRMAERRPGNRTSRAAAAAASRAAPGPGVFRASGCSCWQACCFAGWSGVRRNCGCVPNKTLY